MSTFHPITKKLPEMFEVLGMSVSMVVLVVTATGARHLAALWDDTWRSADTGKTLENVTHWCKAEL